METIGNLENMRTRIIPTYSKLPMLLDPILYHPPKYFRSGGNVTRRFLGSTVTVSSKCWAQFNSNWSRKTWWLGGWWPPGPRPLELARTRPIVWIVWIVVFWLLTWLKTTYRWNKCKENYFGLIRLISVIDWDVTPGAPGAGTIYEIHWNSLAMIHDTATAPEGSRLGVLRSQIATGRRCRS